MAGRLRPYRLGRAALILQRNGYSEEEVDLLLGAGRWKEKRREYVWDRVRVRRYRTPEGLAGAVIDWALENGRWPETRDFGNWNGLPSPGTMRWRTGGLTNNPTWRAVNGRWQEVSNDSLWRFIANEAYRLPIPLLLSIPNLTNRREAVRIFGGPQALIEKGGGTKLQQDDFGTLWWVPAFEPGEWRAVYVEVVNSTQKLDEKTNTFVFDKQGEPVYDHYFLRVPPTIMTAKDAVAWTGHFRQGGPDGWDLSEFEGFAVQS